MARAIDRPDVADAYNKALDLEEAGDFAGAALAYAAYLRLDPADHGGAAVRLAAMGQAEAPLIAPGPYVEVLFDQHAEAFEDILVRQLGYDVPNLAADRLSRLGKSQFSRVLDLGCGTGLFAEALGERAREIIGLDISSRMIDVAEAKDIYDGLYCGEVNAFLSDNDEDPFDLIAACDVLPYIGDLTPLFNGAAANLTDAGLLVFSSELSAEDGYQVAPHQRFIHSETYLQDRVSNAGLQLLEITGINVRMQSGKPTPGQLVIAQRTA